MSFSSSHAIKTELSIIYTILTGDIKDYLLLSFFLFFILVLTEPKRPWRRGVNRAVDELRNIIESNQKENTSSCVIAEVKQQKNLNFMGNGLGESGTVSKKKTPILFWSLKLSNVEHDNNLDYPARNTSYYLENENTR